jgi:hypothetical protein
MQRNFKLLMILILFSVFSMTVSAGVVVKGVDKSEAEKKSPSTVYIDKDKLRIETSNENENEIIIFRQDKGLLWIINQNKMTYMEMTRKDIAQMTEQIDQAMKQLEEQMKNMPAEQREMMKKMMPSTLTDKSHAKILYKKKADGVKINKWSTTQYVGMLDGEKKSEVWTIKWAQANIAEADVSALRGMGEFFEALAGEIDEFYQMGSDEFAKEGGYAGMPVKFVNYEDGKITNDYEISEINKQSLNQSLFELPPNLKKEEKPFGKMPE